MQLRRWLLDPARKQALEAAFEHDVDSPNANHLATAIDAFQWLR